ncbi:two-component system response regulator [Chromobacterium phragmitis]|uniref:Two-component system response regulator n=1 Tax=Chromobacterium phragmitis TaxID=2202141 RepID=A0A344UHD8_9NEIS|nr:two-component system response regulator [Chromobacterium phragmitis]AXE29314.1 two-component system response regulator [Chromobacterium phragmitis]AXE34686.1 two-component system response regulator [Chromobacterium phragmitis]
MASQPDKRPTVLAVDDTPDNLALISDLLHRAYRIKVATGGARALQIVASAEPDLILLDVMMPEMDGYEVLRRLQASRPGFDVPVIFLTAKQEAEDETAGLQLGAADYIHKPINPGILMARVRNQLDVKAARDFLKNQNDYLESEVRRRTQETEMVQNVAIWALASLAETRDNETGNHIKRTQFYVKLLAEQLRGHPRFDQYLSERNIDMICKSAPLHDIGKVGIPDHILLKAGKLTDDEFAIMKQHAALGRDAIVAAERQLGLEAAFLSFAKEIACSHHEKWDGSGYPYGLKGDEIPVAGRLMALADVYDALVSRRIYKPPLPHAQARDIIVAGSGRHFDPDVVDAFLAVEASFIEVAQTYADAEEAAGQH